MARSAPGTQALPTTQPARDEASLPTYVPPPPAGPDAPLAQGEPPAQPAHRVISSGGQEVEYRFDPAARDAWLADCHARLAQRDAGTCEAYLDRYAAQYVAAARGQASYVYGYAPGMTPVMMVPVEPQASAQVAPGH